MRLWNPLHALDGLLGLFFPRGGSSPPPWEPPGPLAPITGTCAALIPAHNEGPVIEATLRSVLGAFKAEDVFVFADACSDDTVAICRTLLPAENVLDYHPNIGKSHGIQTMLASVIYPRRYEFVAFVDADTVVEPGVRQKCLWVLRDKDVAAACAQVKTASYPQIFGVYRTFMYFVHQNIMKRAQSILDATTIASGCSTVWRTNVLRQLEFDHKMSTEDFGLTIQTHRRHLGKVKYVSSASVWSQDPHNLRAFAKQSYRWSRAWWEAVRKYKIGLKWFRTGKWGLPVGLSMLDIFTAVLFLLIYGFWFRIFSMPFLLIHPIDVGLDFYFPTDRESVLIGMAFQYGVLLVPYIVVGIATRKWRIITFLPIVLAVQLLDFILGVKAMGAVMLSLYRRPKKGKGGATATWVSPERKAMQASDFLKEKAS